MNISPWKSKIAYLYYHTKFNHLFLILDWTAHDGAARGNPPVRAKTHRGLWGPQNRPQEAAGGSRERGRIPLDEINGRV